MCSLIPVIRLSVMATRWVYSPRSLITCPGFGFDNFVSQCIDATFKCHQKNIYARMIKSDYQSNRFEYVANQVRRPRPDILKARYPKNYQLLEERNQTFITFYLYF